MEHTPTHKPYVYTCCRCIPCKCCCVMQRTKSNVSNYEYYAQWNITLYQNAIRIGLDHISVIVEYVAAMNLQIMNEYDEDFMLMIQRNVMETRANPREKDVDWVCKTVAERINKMAQREEAQWTEET
eukprot:909201_1